MGLLKLRLINWLVNHPNGGYNLSFVATVILRGHWSIPQLIKPKNPAEAGLDIG
jgi:hypothetical protein